MKNCGKLTYLHNLTVSLYITRAMEGVSKEVMCCGAGTYSSASSLGGIPSLAPSSQDRAMQSRRAVAAALDESAGSDNFMDDIDKILAD